MWSCTETKAKELFNAIIPKLSLKQSKGGNGKVCIFGGSHYYAGAPYFSAISALRLGADLAYVVCFPDAAAVIKSYSPDLIVLPLLGTPSFTEDIKPWIKRCNSFVVGPGLGREASLMTPLKILFRLIQEENKPCVIDADGLYFVMRDTSMVRNQGLFFLTPNDYELKNMCSILGSDSVPCNLSDLSHALGDVSILCKGETDTIIWGNKKFSNNLRGSPRRCGGQGDILSGVLSQMMYYTTLHNTADFLDVPKNAAAGLVASYFVRTLNDLAYQKNGISTLTSDMLLFFKPAVDELLSKPS